MFDWQFAGKTDVGMRREANEDCINMHPELGIAILADGMGGHKGGEIASAMAASGISEDLTGAAAGSEGEEAASKATEIGDLLTRSITRVNREIFVASSSTEQYKGMGTTIVVAVAEGDRLSYAHVGDSRLYRFRDNHLEPLTSDHSLVNELLAQGYYKTPEEAAQAKQKNVITRAVGIDDKVEVDVDQVTVEEGDIFLLCSDGLSDMVPDIDISDLMKEHQGDLDQAVEVLVQKANDEGGRDNISVILLQANKQAGGIIKKSLNWLFKN